MEIGMSLEDIIKSKPELHRRGGGRGGRARGGGGAGRSTGARGGARSSGRGGRFSSGGGRPGRSNGAWTHDKFQGQGTRGWREPVGMSTRGSGGGDGGNKITVSNLHFGVSDGDIMELFGELGPIRYASVHYDRSGRSMGKADVTFERAGDAQCAITEYNGVPLDGRPMTITLADGSGAAAGGSAPRVLRQVLGGRVGQRRGTSSFTRGGGGGGRGRGAARGTGGRGEKQKPLTAAELDAELDAYVNANPK